VAGYFVMRNFVPTAIVAKVTRGEVVDAVTGSVTVDADGGIRPLKSEAAGRVIKCTALVADARFKKGDIVLELDDTDLKREIENAKETYRLAQERAAYKREKDPARELAKQNLANMERIFKLGDISEETLNASKRALAQIETELELANKDEQKAKFDFETSTDRSERMLEKMKVLAPFDGQSQTLMTFEGAIINGGDTVAMTLSNARVVTVKISEDSIAKVRLGQDAEVTLLTYPGEKFAAKVVKILSTADESQRFNVFLEVKTDEERLKHGSTGEARITIDRRDNQPRIPRRALFNGNNVYVVKNGRVEMRKVEVGFLAMNLAEIRQGIEEGDLVIVEHLDQFVAGRRVRLPEPAPTGK